MPEMGSSARRRAIRIKGYFFEKDGLLMRRFTPVEVEGVVAERDDIPNLTRRDRELQKMYPSGRIVVPRTMIATVLSLFHGPPLTGHNGRNKTIDLVKSRFYWGGLVKDVRARVKGCHLCQMRKPARPTRHIRPGGFVTHSPFEMVLLDVVGPLPNSDGYTKLLTGVDVFSKYPFAIPVENEKAETVA